MRPYYHPSSKNNIVCIAYILTINVIINLCIRYAKWYPTWFQLFWYMQHKAKASQTFYLSEVITCCVRVVFIVAVKTLRWKAKSRCALLRIQFELVLCTRTERMEWGLCKPCWRCTHPLSMLKVGLWPCTWVKCGFLVSENASHRNALVRSRNMQTRIWSGPRATGGLQTYACWVVLFCMREVIPLTLPSVHKCTACWYFAYEKYQTHFALPGISQWLG